MKRFDHNTPQKAWHGRGSSCRALGTTLAPGIRPLRSPPGWLRHIHTGQGSQLKASGCAEAQTSPPRDAVEQRRGGGGSGTQKFVYQKWPESIIPFVNFNFSHHEIWIRGGGGGDPGGGGPGGGYPGMHWKGGRYPLCDMWSI